MVGVGAETVPGEVLPRCGEAVLKKGHGSTHTATPEGEFLWICSYKRGLNLWYSKWVLRTPACTAPVSLLEMQNLSSNNTYQITICILTASPMLCIKAWV